MVRGREEMNRTEVIDCATFVVTKLDMSSCVSTSSGRVFGIFNVYGVVLGKGRDGRKVVGDLMSGVGTGLCWNVTCLMSVVEMTEEAGW
tara:strand:- start:66 stop:332 length:267 start_codon:yes stop_codon:yes gene_type:complete